MAKKSDKPVQDIDYAHLAKKTDPGAAAVATGAAADSDGKGPADEVTAASDRPPMKRKEYDRQLRELQAELVAMQEWVKTTGARVCVVFATRPARAERSRRSPTA